MIGLLREIWLFFREIILKLSTNSKPILMRKFHPLFVLLFLFGLSVCVLSCNEDRIDEDSYGSIRGTVKASDGGLPLEGVSVATNPGTTVVSTDAEGNFTLGEVLVGTYSVSAKKVDFTSENFSVNVESGQEVFMSIIMNIAPEESEVPDDPVYVSPLDASDQHPVDSVALVWNIGETIEGDTLRYDVILYEGGDDFVGTKLVSNTLDTTLLVSGLLFETPYRWKVIARNRSLDEAEGREWKFRTEDYPNNRFFFVKDTLGSKDIYSWDLAEGHLVRLTTDGNSQIHPRLSPNRERLAYSSHETGAYHIYTMDKKGQNVLKITQDRPLASYHNNGIGFCWTHGGNRIIYSHYDELWQVNRDGTGAALIANAPDDRHFRGCNWNKYTDKVVFLAIGVEPYESEIYIMDYGGANLEVLVDSVPGVLSGPQFSIDGTQVIFSQDVSGLQGDDGRQLDARIFRIDVDGSNLTDLSNNGKTAGTNDLQAIYSPDGGKIIFMNEPSDGLGVKNIWTMDINGGGRELIIPNAEMPEWN